MKAIITSISMLAIATTLAFAQDKPSGPPPGGQGGSGGPGGPGGSGQGQRPSPEEIFKRLDTNHDGVLSLEEFKAHRPQGGQGQGGKGGPGNGGQGGGGQGKGGKGGPGGGPGGKGGPAQGA